MTKKYQHKPPVQKNQLEHVNAKLAEELQDARKELDKLQIALRMITGEDKETLTKAIEKVQYEKEQAEKWANIQISSDGWTTTPATWATTKTPAYTHTYAGTSTVQIIYDDAEASK